MLDLVRRKIAAIEAGELANPSILAALYASALPLVRYVARAVADDSPASATLVDEIARWTEEYLTTTWPERFPEGSRRARDAAAVLVAQSAGSIVLHEHVARLMGLEAWTDILSPRISLAQLDVYEAVGESIASGLGSELRSVIGEE